MTAKITMSSDNLQEVSNS